MKKILVFALAALLMLSTALPCFAEENAKEKDDVFTFARGARWGMSRADVMALEDMDEDADFGEEDESGLTDLMVSGVKVSKYAAELAYMFLQDELCCIVYYIPAPSDGGDVSYRYLQGALSSLYGEPSNEDESAFLRFADNIEKWAARDDREEISLISFDIATVWHIAGDTDVLLGDVDGETLIIYYNTAFDFATAKFDTTGL
ncbi:MAG: hypothetical protein ACOYI8_05890 [Christensenellales bacterium]|jgi:hypothetical protein